MDSTEPINSTLDDKFLAHSRLEKDKDQGYKNVVQQSIYEEKLANNGLYASIFIHVFVVLSTLLIILFKFNLVSIYKENNPDAETINFSLFQFNLKNVENQSNSYSYFCIEDKKEFFVGNSTEESYFECVLKESCVKRGLNTTLIREYFDFDCKGFFEFRNIGIIVRFV